MKEKLKKLRARRTEIQARMQELIDAGLTDENRPEFDQLRTEAETVRGDIERTEAVMDEQRALEGDVHRAAPVPTPGIKMGDAPEDRSFPTLEENIGAICRAGLQGVMDPRLREAPAPPDGAAVIGEQRAATGLSEGVPADGGFFLQSEHASNLLDAMFETGFLLPRVRNYTITNPAVNAVEFVVLDETSRAAGSRLGGLRLYTRDEAETVTATKPKWRKVEYKPQSVMGLCYFTAEQLEDTPFLVQQVTDYFTNEAGFDIDDWILRGDGASQPEGIFNNSAFVSQAAETNQAADTVVKENLDKMWSRMPARLRRNGVWVNNQECEPQMLGLSIPVGTGGAPVYLPGGNIADAPFGTIYGRPVLPMEQASALGDANDMSFIDPNSYLIVRKGGMRSELSIHVRFIYGEVVMRFMFRMAGKSWYKSAITPYKGAASLSPFIGLAART